MKFAVLLAAISILCGVASAADKPASSSVDPAYQQSFDQWKNELVEDLKQEWLPLAGLFWLKPGENTFGTDPKNAVVFPKGPAHAGSFNLHGKTVTATFTSDSHAVIEGKPVSTAELQPDTSGKTTVVEMGNLRFHVIVRGERVGIRLKDLDSDAVRQYQGAQFFPLDLSYRVTATWLPSDGKQTVDVPNVLGDVTADTSCRNGGFQNQRSGTTAHRPRRRRCQGPVLRIQRSHQQDQYLPRRPLSKNRSGYEWHCRARFQSCLQSSVRGYGVRDVSARAEGEPVERCHPGRPGIRPQTRSPLIIFNHEGHEGSRRNSLVNLRVLRGLRLS